MEMSQIKPKLVQFLLQINQHLRMCATYQQDMFGQVFELCESQLGLLVRELVNNVMHMQFDDEELELQVFFNLTLLEVASSIHSHFCSKNYTELASSDKAEQPIRLKLEGLKTLVSSLCSSLYKKVYLQFLQSLSD